MMITGIDKSKCSSSCSYPEQRPNGAVNTTEGQPKLLKREITALTCHAN